jgi:hypothetical protein
VRAEKEKDRMVEVKVHVLACFHPALYRVPHGLGAVVQHLRDAIRVTLNHPLTAQQLKLYREPSVSRLDASNRMSN